MIVYAKLKLGQRACGQYFVLFDEAADLYDGKMKAASQGYVAWNGIRYKAGPETCCG